MSRQRTPSEIRAIHAKETGAGAGKPRPVPASAPSGPPGREGDYTLYRDEVRLNDGKRYARFFFAKNPPDRPGVKAASIPPGYKVEVMANGLPLLKRKSGAPKEGPIAAKAPREAFNQKTTERRQEFREEAAERRTAFKDEGKQRRQAFEAETERRREKSRQRADEARRVATGNAEGA
jgi:hypothetical protein